MIGKTISKELKELFRDGRIRLAGIIVLLLLGVAVWISSSQYKLARQHYETARKAERALWENQGEKNPHSAAHYGTYAFKPEYPLGLLDKGIDKYAGTSIYMEAHKRNEAQYSPVADQTGLARFGELTPDFILLFIIPLLIMLMGYNSYTKEKELGTLSLLKSQGVKGWKILFGKWSALFLPVATLTLLLFLIAGGMISGSKEFESFSWASLGLLFLVYLVYYAIFVNIVLLVSRLAKRSGIALVTLLGIWILACLAVPKAAGNFADARYPYPTRQEFNTAVLKDKEEGLDGHNPWSEEAKRLEKETLEQYGVDSLQQLPFNYDALRMQKGEEHQAEVYKKHYGELREQFSDQAATYRNLSVLSPFLPVRFLSMAIARTDYYAHWDFADAAEDYRIATQKFLNDEFAENSGYGDWGYLSDADTWKKLPEFKYRPPALNVILEQQQSALWILAGWWIVTFVFLLNLKNKL